MKKDLKTQNLVSLTAIYVGTFFLLTLFYSSAQEVLDVSVRLVQKATLVGAVTSFGAVLSNLLPNSIKHPLVYFRLRNVLSGHRCKRICTKDPRVTVSHLENKWPDLFAKDMPENIQNSYWYHRIYKSVKNSPEVLQAHRSFLLYRDSASGLTVILVGLLIWNTIAKHVHFSPLNVWSFLMLIVIILVLCQAGRQSGDRMVTNAVVVALESENKALEPVQGEGK